MEIYEKMINQWVRQTAADIESEQTQKTDKYLTIQPVVPNSDAHRCRQNAGKEPVGEGEDPNGKNWLFYWE